MRLKNKRTGEIGELQVTEKHCAVAVGNGTASCGLEIYSSLARLYEEWEDVPEEPKEFWYISDFGYVISHAINNKSVKSTIEEMKSIGNYFETKEEAEQTVEKLKAWKRLRDKGFRFNDWHARLKNGVTIYARYDEDDGVVDDLKMLFGGEE